MAIGDAQKKDCEIRVLLNETFDHRLIQLQEHGMGATQLHQAHCMEHGGGLLQLLGMVQTHHCAPGGGFNPGSPLNSSPPSSSEIAALICWR